MRKPSPIRSQGRHSKRRACPSIQTKTIHETSRTVHLRPPVELGTFSLDSKRQFQHNSSKLAHLRDDWKNIKADLYDGFPEKFIQRDETKSSERLTFMLKWILENLDKFRLHTGTLNSLNTDFVCFRGHLTKILLTPFENKDGWVMDVVKYKDTWYISELDFTRDDSSLLKYMYAGYKYEKCMTVEAGDLVNINEAFCTVVRTRLSQHSLIYSGEVDCIDSEGNYVELKTTGVFVGRRESSFWKYKAKKFWAQSMLIGIPRIVCGMRSDSGNLVENKEFKVKDIPALASDFNAQFSSSEGLNFLEQFLSHVRREMNEDGIVYRCIFSPKDAMVNVEKVMDHSVYDAIIPEWYRVAIDNAFTQ